MYGSNVIQRFLYWMNERHAYMHYNSLSPPTKGVRVKMMSRIHPTYKTLLLDQAIVESSIMTQNSLQIH